MAINSTGAKLQTVPIKIVERNKRQRLFPGEREEDEGRGEIIHLMGTPY